VRKVGSDEYREHADYRPAEAIKQLKADKKQWICGQGKQQRTDRQSPEPDEEQRRRFGYRRLGLMLKRQGIKLNRKKLYRLYKEVKAERTQARWPQTGTGHAGADGDPAGSYRVPLDLRPDCPRVRNFVQTAMGAGR
jgi:hypothetical protein